MQQTQAQVKAALLGLVLLASLMLKSGHQMLLHHEHQTKPVCEAHHSGTSTHLHDERYNPDACSLCAFLFATPELSLVSVLLKKPDAPAKACPAAPPAPHLRWAHQMPRLRGPPGLLYRG